ncbi:unnamed protein product [Schistocephalus solidus]|uniref:BRO1 domain-containing protein n=1 Tax=Schistocephalus solidus TaxID=70667 RepID=A0A183SBD9_SCHSO|nr:unnamed protein product [Schistocephalus solidus]
MMTEDLHPDPAHPRKFKNLSNPVLPEMLPPINTVRPGTKLTSDDEILFDLKRQDNKSMVPVIASSSHLFSGMLIFASISNIFGREALESARRWEIFALRLSSTYAQIQFLHRCLDNHVLPKSLSYKPPVNTSLAKRWVSQQSRRMISVLLQDCHLQLRKYNGVSSQAVVHCAELIGENGVRLLQQVIDKRARHL